MSICNLRSLRSLFMSHKERLMVLRVLLRPSIAVALHPLCLLPSLPALLQEPEMADSVSSNTECLHLEMAEAEAEAEAAGAEVEVEAAGAGADGDGKPGAVEGVGTISIQLPSLVSCS